MPENTNTNTNADTNTNEPDTAKGASEPDAIDQIIARFDKIIRAAEAEHQRTEKLASVPDNVPRFVTEYRS